MPKIAYKHQEFRTKTMDLINLCNQIIRTYQAQGYSLTLRQLYYRLVAGGNIPNRQKEYKRLGSIITNARLAGLIDWYAIEDRTRALKDKSRWDNPTSIMDAVLSGFIIDRWEDQPVRVEVWVEKDALIGVIGRAASEMDVPYFSCRGYTSQSSMWLASRRLRRWMDEKAQDVLIIHLADHDPSGIDMTRDVEDRMDVFWAENIDVDRIALNMDQVQQYGPPPNPAKVTDSRFNTYVHRFGYDSWELDALEPAVLHALVTDTILEVRDEKIWTETIDREAAMMAVLNEAHDHVRENDEWR